MFIAVFAILLFIIGIAFFIGGWVVFLRDQFAGCVIISISCIMILVGMSGVIPDSPVVVYVDGLAKTIGVNISAIE
jgi:hypothetical protein